MKKFNIFLLVSLMSLGSMSAQIPSWGLSDPIFQNDWKANVDALYATRAEYKIYNTPVSWDPAISDVSDVWSLLPEGYALDSLFTGKRVPTDAADFTATVKYMYDVDNLYALLNVTDNYIYPADSSKQESFEIMYAPYADSLSYADLYAFGEQQALAQIDSTYWSGKNPIDSLWSWTPTQMLGYWSQLGAFKTSLNALGGTNNSYIDYTYAGPWSSGAINWGAPCSNLGIETKFTKKSATTYTYLITIPFASAMNGYVPTSSAKIALEVKIIDKDPGQATNIEAAHNSNNNNLFVSMAFAGRGVFEWATGVEGNKASKFAVYPNPATSSITISNFNELKKVVISDITGRQVKTISAVTSNISLDLNKGTYLVQMIAKDNSTSTQKLVIR